MKLTKTSAAVLAMAVGATGQTAVKHIQTPNAAIASAVWAGDTLYVSGQLPNPVTPADREKGTAAVYGDTKTQASSALTKIQALLKDQGLGMGDVVMMHVYLVGDPANGGKLDFAGMNAAYSQFLAPRNSRISPRAAPCRWRHWRPRDRWWRSRSSR
jgi:enamine deaminase RidA (YjgF/YER057c/UK114 family)